MLGIGSGNVASDEVMCYELQVCTFLHGLVLGRTPPVIASIFVFNGFQTSCSSHVKTVQS